MTVKKQCFCTLKGVFLLYTKGYSYVYILV